MDLGVFDRITLINILPAEGDFRTLRILRELREALAFSEEENAALGFRDEGAGLVRWRSEADIPKHVEIGPVAHAVIAARLRRLSDQGHLREEHMALFERFVELSEADLAPDVERAGVEA